MVRCSDRPASPMTIFAVRRRLAFHRLLERGAHVGEQVLANHAQEIEAGRAGRLFKMASLPRNSSTRKSESIVTPHGLKRRSKTRSPALRTSADSPGAPLPHRFGARVQKSALTVQRWSRPLRALLRKDFSLRVHRFEEIVESIGPSDKPSTR